MTAMIGDVARQSGVDPKVAERVLRAGLQDIGGEAVSKVLESAAALGFSGGPEAHSLGILYAEESGRGLTHPFFVPILNAIKEEAEANGYDVTFINYHVTQSGMSYAEHCGRLGVAGVCLVCVDFDAPEIRALVESGLPCVTVDHMFKGVPAVMSDNETGVQKLVEHAIGMGHRRIAFVHGHNNSVVTRTRIRQFKNTMAYYSLDVPGDYIREGRYDNIPLTRKLVRELLTLPVSPTCILLPDDMAYLGAQDAARELNLSVPRDISFAGYDGITLGQALEPKLTTIRQSSLQLGATAARTLIKRIENPAPRKQLPVIFPVEFVEGGTIGPAPQSDLNGG